MIDGKSVLAVIPARGGSKRVPRKNLQAYKGKSLIEWAAAAAKKSKYIDYLAISSEDKEILEHARKFATTLERPAWLATDRAMNEGVLVHTLYTWKWADWVVLLQPTSPQRTTEDIDVCIERAQLGTGCVSYNQHAHRNGAVYVTKSTELIARIDFKPELLDQFFMMPQERSLDIDYPIDLVA